MVSAQSNERPSTRRVVKSGKRPTLTNGPAAMLQSVAPGRGGGATYATPPRGQSTIWSAWPPTCRQANACPSSCSRTMTNNARYSKTFHVSEEYPEARFSISNAPTTNQDQCKYRSTPANRNKWNDPFRVGVMRVISAFDRRLQPCRKECRQDEQRTRENP